jgi:hypothetical protein
MTRSTRIESIPWMVPVPVKPSSFTPLFQRDRALNVEVDLGEISAFRGRAAPIGNRRIAYADLQTNADLNSSLRLGAGRAALYRGRYLKGIGRTSLAANWNCDGADLLHSSGIMLANAAIREYLVSAFVGAHDLTEAIHPCTGLLLRVLPPSLTRHARNSFYARPTHGRTKGRNYVSKADRAMQAIAVKPGGFARFSNIHWWLCNYPPRLGAAQFFTVLARSLDPRASEAGLDADAIVARLFTAVERTIANLLHTWSIGIHWGSFHNNATIDGRFLDLENPAVFPWPVVGSLVPLGAASEATRTLDAAGELVGFSDIVKILRHIKSFVNLLELRMKYIADNQLCEPLEARFMLELARSLEQKRRQATVLSSQRALERRVVPWIATRLGAGTLATGVLRRAFREACWRSQMFPSIQRPSSRGVVLHRVQMPIALARPEPWVQDVLYVPDFLRDAVDTPVPSHALVNQAILSAEGKRDPDELLSELATVPRRLGRAARAEVARGRA